MSLVGHQLRCNGCEQDGDARDVTRVSCCSTERVSPTVVGLDVFIKSSQFS